VSDPAADRLPHQLGHFRVRGLLGEGGSGTVYEAAWGHRRVALKVLRKELLRTDREQERFLVEAALLQAVDHPGVVKVLGHGTLPDGRPYLAMEHLDGEALAARIARGPLPLAEALTLFDQLASAVHALHLRGLVHRDIKPENIILTGSFAVLLDFGIAKAENAPASTITQEGSIRGTPAYMAPERFFGAAASPSTDIYELAVVFYAMVTGRLPWNDVADPSARLNPPRPSSLGYPLPEHLETVLLQALSTRAEARPASVAELARGMLAAANSPVPRHTEDLPPIPPPAGW
jgi:eukaryotic-like serine/threonine-protein kinase